MLGIFINFYAQFIIWYKIFFFINLYSLFILFFLGFLNLIYYFMIYAFILILGFNIYFLINLNHETVKFDLQREELNLNYTICIWTWLTNYFFMWYLILFVIIMIWNDSVWNFKVPIVSWATRQVKLVVKSRVLHILIKSVNTQCLWIRNLLDYK